MQKKHPWKNPINMRTKPTIRDCVTIASSQAIDASNLINISSAGYGRDYRYNGVSLNFITNRTLKQSLVPRTEVRGLLDESATSL